MTTPLPLPSSAPSPSSPPDFTVTVDPPRFRGDPVHVRVVGELDAWAAPMLTHALTRLRIDAVVPAQRRGGSSREIVLDLSRLSFLDSAGVAALTDSRAALVADGWHVRFGPVQTHVRRLLDYAVDHGWLPGGALDPAVSNARTG